MRCPVRLGKTVAREGASYAPRNIPPGRVVVHPPSSGDQSPIIARYGFQRDRCGVMSAAIRSWNPSPRREEKPNTMDPTNEMPAGVAVGSNSSDTSTLLLEVLPRSRSRDLNYTSIHVVRW